MSASKVTFTLADLNEALKPWIDAVKLLQRGFNDIKDETSKNNLQLSELGSLVNNVSVKLDTMEQTFGQAANDGRTVAKPVGKGKATKKTATRKTATKKTASKKVKDEEKDEEKDDDKEDDSGDESDKSTKSTKSTAGKKKPVVKKPPATATKKTATKKIATKKTASKKTATKKAVSKPNIMNIFKLKFKEDESQFDEWLSDAKEQIEEEHKEEWDDLSEAELLNKRSAVYYTYMKTNHPNVLEEHKEAYLAENAEAPAEEEDDE